ncbi:WAP four-disulfide core domain protein 2-like [Hemicordylus capensis]|uniref:WAP four-disulfide core domain protein 2-like n=1 Tax=Hemicordylus capensis TaxID=884348 RepID=UPI002302545A|nr:WAP four-disulfide core domain protein 2-like [Hemicordylus capensis]
MRSGLVLLMGLLALWMELTSASHPAKGGAGKPGICPHPSVGICPDRCNSDDDCTGNLKCCRIGCGRTCTKPIFPEKPGECPKFKIKPGMPCKRNCWHDHDCKGTDKCCTQGCSKICFAAGLPSPPEGQLLPPVGDGVHVH